MTSPQIRLVAYSPNGPRTSFLTHPLSWDAALPHNDVSAATLEYSAAAQAADLLQGEVELGVEVALLDGWVEPPNARFLSLVWDADIASSSAEIVKYSFPGYGFLLDKVSVLPAGDGLGDPASYDEEGKRKFLNANPGQILATVLAEARAFDAEILPGLLHDFTTTRDSTGAPWSKRVTIYYEPGTSVLTIISNLADQGIVDWQMQGRTLQVFNADDALAQDLSNRVVFPPGPAGGTEEAPTKRTIESLLHIAILRGDEGRTWVKQNPATPRPWGKTMSVINQGGVRDEATANILIQADLDQGSRERIEYTRKLDVASTPFLPLVDYAVGSYVKAIGRKGALEKLRVHQVTLSGPDPVKVTLTLNDRFQDHLVRQAKRTRGIVGGATSDGGSGSTPTPISPPSALSRVPAARESLTVSSSAYFDSEGRPRAGIHASWPAVTKGIDGYAIEIDDYECWSQQTLGTWLFLGSTNHESIGIDGLIPGDTHLVQVRARSASGRLGAYSPAESAQLPWPELPVSPPSAPELTSSMGTISAHWDGTLILDDGSRDAPPPQFESIRAEVAFSEYGPWNSAKSQSLRAAGAIVLTGYPIGTTQWVRFVAENSTGARTPGTSSSVIVVGVQGPDLEANSVTANALDAGSVRAEHLAIGARYAYGEAQQRIPAPVTDVAYWRLGVSRTLPFALVWRGVSVAPEGLMVQKNSGQAAEAYLTPKLPLPPSKKIQIIYEAVQDPAFSLPANGFVSVGWFLDLPFPLERTVVQRSGDIVEVPSWVPLHGTYVITIQWPNRDFGIMIRDLQAFEVLGTAGVEITPSQQVFTDGNSRLTITAQGITQSTIL